MSIAVVSMLLFYSSAFCAPPDLLELRERTRAVVTSIRCASCHTPGLSTTKENALKVYNLGSSYWSSSMSDRQLRDFQRRLKDKLTPEELKEMGGDPKKEHPLNKKQIALIDDFVKRELQNRRLNPLDRFNDIQNEKYSQAFKVFGTSR